MFRHDASSPAAVAGAVVLTSSALVSPELAFSAFSAPSADVLPGGARR
ncbi:hypothetical protein I6A60_39660 [Frankia sp. AgB1.9]|nr:MULTISPECIES: hypothetical protein [unclassified Frankia]MBL7493089.1 hypothetical protein [Frankia sp. AgW1.1]MBL7553903.1 hypothetical protein [Frankia sp. AgB1.9]MBL7619650.1 hypothetical protein [Frankia sp. AgB1.8]